MPIATVKAWNAGAQSEELLLACPRKCSTIRTIPKTALTLEYATNNSGKLITAANKQQIAGRIGPYTLRTQVIGDSEGVMS